jgi:hypothetical protein
MQLFTQADHRRVVAGEFTTTFRLWKTPHVKKGAVYPTGFGGSYRILDVREVRAGDLTDRDAWASGSPNKNALLVRVGEHTRARVTSSTTLVRVDFAYSDDEAPKKKALDVDEVLRRLAKLDTNRGKPWTKTALTLIEMYPRTKARELAKETDFERLDFKLHVRKLKALGLTTSFKIGYELTDLGQASLDAIRAGATTTPRRSETKRKAPTTRSRSSKSKRPAAKPSKRSR